MSDTITDMPKVAQMLDAGWAVELYKNGLGSYTARGFHPNGRVRDRLPRDFLDELERVETDDFTPEQAMTRLAYKVHGEVI